MGKIHLKWTEQQEKWRPQGDLWPPVRSTHWPSRPWTRRAGGARSPLCSYWPASGPLSSPTPPTPSTSQRALGWAKREYRKRCVSGCVCVHLRVRRFKICCSLEGKRRIVWTWPTLKLYVSSVAWNNSPGGIAEVDRGGTEWMEGAVAERRNTDASFCPQALNLKECSNSNIY